MISQQYIGRFIQKHGLFVALLLFGAVLRVLFISVQGLSHDELSAWNRISDYDFCGVLEYGVKPDMHPAFMQILLQYWVQIFGDNEWVFRLPSTLFGLAGIVLMYHFSLRFLRKEAGLFATILMLFLVFPIMHTSLALPYAPGFFFILLQLHGIFKLEHSRIRKQYFWSSIFIAIGATGAIYTHYYAGLMAGILGVTALFYVAKNRWVYLIAAGFLALFLFLPHWEITKEHLSRDGLGWLSAPEPQWLWDFLVLFFNNNAFLLILFVAAVIYLLIRQKFKIESEYRFLIVSFFILYFFSYLVSLLYTPILREPGVLMILPLLLLGLGGLFSNIPERIFNFGAIGVSIFLMGHTFYQGQMLKTVHFEPFREMTTLMIKADEQFGEENILRFCNVTNINYLNYYARENGASLDFEMTLIEEIDEIHQLAQIVAASDQEYCMLARTNRAQNVIQLEIIRYFFPEVVMHQDFFNTNFTVWKRGDFNNRKFMKGISEATHPGFFKEWNSDSTRAEFIGDFRIPCSILNSIDGYLLFTTDGWIDSTTQSLNFVVVAERKGELLKDGEDDVLYQAWDQMQILQISGKRTFFTAVEIPKKLFDTDVLHIYFWNRNFAKVKINKPKIYVVQAGL